MLFRKPFGVQSIKMKPTSQMMYILFCRRNDCLSFAIYEIVYDPRAMSFSLNRSYKYSYNMIPQF